MISLNSDCLFEIFQHLMVDSQIALSITCCDTMKNCNVMVDYDSDYHNLILNGSAFSLIKRKINLIPSHRPEIIKLLGKVRSKCIFRQLSQYSKQELKLLIESMTCFDNQFIRFIFSETGRGRKPALLKACEYGDEKMVNQFINTNNWKKCLYRACLGGSKNIIEIIISSPIFTLDEGVMDWASEGAAAGGHLKIFEIFSSKCENLNVALGRAVSGNHSKIIDYIINSGKVDNYNDASYEASKAGNLLLLKKFIEIGVSNLNGCRRVSCINGHTNIVEYLINNYDVEYCYEGCDCQKMFMKSSDHN